MGAGKEEECGDHSEYLQGIQQIYGGWLKTEIDQIIMTHLVVGLVKSLKVVVSWPQAGLATP